MAANRSCLGDGSSENLDVKLTLKEVKNYMEIKSYTGIGSRDASELAMKMGSSLGRRFARLGFILRSGAARGMDTAFESGCNLAHGRKEIYLPFSGFNQRIPSGNPLQRVLAVGENPLAEEEARNIHPNWAACSRFARQAHTRSVCQVLGEDLKSPSTFVVAWTPTGQDTGGSRTALVLARERDIPVYNLYKLDERLELKEYLESLEEVPPSL